MPDLVTRCPECGTRFNAAADQLDIAGGLVRCGVCLTVFDGREHRDTPAGPVSQPDSIPPEAQPPTPAVGEAFDAPAPAPAEPHPEHQTESRADLEDPVRFDDDSAPPSTWSQAPASETTITEAGTDPAPETTTATESETPPEIDSGTDYPLSPPAGQEPATLDEAASDTVEADPEQRADALSVPTLAAPEPLQAPILTSEVFAPGEQPSAPRTRTLLWTTLSLLALIVLAGQYTWFHAGELATRFEHWRPELARFCELARCELPMRSDLNRIQVSGLVVRTHPQQPDALLVEARLVNRASFSQPLPPLTLQFEDLQGQPVARRTFTARQYAPDIAGAGPAMIASLQQVPVRLEISDPGPAAVSYLLSPARQ